MTKQELRLQTMSCSIVLWSILSKNKQNIVMVQVRVFLLESPSWITVPWSRVKIKIDKFGIQHGVACMDRVQGDISLLNLEKSTLWMFFDLFPNRFLLGPFVYSSPLTIWTQIIPNTFQTSKMYSVILNTYQKAQAKASLWCRAWYSLLVTIPIWTTTTWRNQNPVSYLQSV